MAKPKPKDEVKGRRVEVRIEDAMYQRAMRVCSQKSITLSHIVRRGLAWALPIVERDPSTGAPDELQQRAPRQELKAWEPSRPPSRSREPF
jgi:hypothetical protein